MQYTITVTDARLVAGLSKQLAAYNAGQSEADQLTAEQFIVAMLPLQQWADAHAPASVPLGIWLQRWTDAERAGAFALGSQDERVKALWLQMLAHSEVQPDNPDLQAGVPLVCAALEQMGVIASGQGAFRAAAISAF
jgi:hypothetical protein